MEREIDLTHKFTIGFWGKFIPLQGVPYIIEVAKILEVDSDIRFEIIGNGQTYKKAMDLSHGLKSNNINFIDFVPFIDLPKRIKKYDLCLGIFGETAKTLRVIPNKVYEAISLGKPVISAKTPAIEELFTDGENILLCQTANPADLAQKILLLKNNSALRNKIGAGGYLLYQERCRPTVIAQQLLADLNIS